MTHTHFIEKKIKYDGSQLTSHFAYNNFGLLGDSIVAFIGPCDVQTTHMVDLEDVRQNLFIFSENMLHFIVEHFSYSLEHTVALQRLLITNLIQDIEAHDPEIRLQRRGDDIFDDVCKLSVSIATRSPVSTLIHVGVNISSANTPVLTKGLDDYKLNPQAVARGTMNRYKDEVANMARARAKVRGVN